MSAKDPAEIAEIAELEALRDAVVRAQRPLRWNPEAEDVQKATVQLVLALVDFLRELMERQAIGRMERGTLSDAQTEAVGKALMELDATIEELARRFGLEREELNLDLGPLGRLL